MKMVDTSWMQQRNKHTGDSTIVKRYLAAIDANTTGTTLDTTISSSTLSSPLSSRRPKSSRNGKSTRRLEQSEGTLDLSSDSFIDLYASVNSCGAADLQPQRTAAGRSKSVTGRSQQQLSSTKKGRPPHVRRISSKNVRPVSFFPTTKPSNELFRAHDVEDDYFSDNSSLTSRRTSESDFLGRDGLSRECLFDLDESLSSIEPEHSEPKDRSKPNNATIQKSSIRDHFAGSRSFSSSIDHSLQLLLDPGAWALRSALDEIAEPVSTQGSRSDSSKSNKDISGNSSEASTDVATNRAIDLAMKRIREIERTGPSRVLKAMRESRKAKLVNPEKHQLTHQLSSVVEAKSNGWSGQDDNRMNSNDHIHGDLLLQRNYMGYGDSSSKSFRLTSVGVEIDCNAMSPVLTNCSTKLESKLMLPDLSDERDLRNAPMIARLKSNQNRTYRNASKSNSFTLATSSAQPSFSRESHEVELSPDPVFCSQLSISSSSLHAAMNQDNVLYSPTDHNSIEELHTVEHERYQSQLQASFVNWALSPIEAIVNSGATTRDKDDQENRTSCATSLRSLSASDAYSSARSLDEAIRPDGTIARSLQQPVDGIVNIHKLASSDSKMQPHSISVATVGHASSVQKLENWKSTSGIISTNKRKTPKIAAAFLAAISKPDVDTPLSVDEDMDKTAFGKKELVPIGSSERNSLVAPLGSTDVGTRQFTCTDVRTLRSAFESSTAHVDDDNDSGSVKSIRERFEESSYDGNSTGGISKMREVFEGTRKRPTTKRFESGNLALREVFSKFEGISKKPLKGRQRWEKQLHQRKEKQELIEVEIVHKYESDVAATLSVADRIRAFHQRAATYLNADRKQPIGRTTLQSQHTTKGRTPIQIGVQSSQASGGMQRFNQKSPNIGPLITERIDTQTRLGSQQVQIKQAFTGQRAMVDSSSQPRSNELRAARTATGSLSMVAPSHDSTSLLSKPVRSFSQNTGDSTYVYDSSPSISKPVRSFSENMANDSRLLEKENESKHGNKGYVSYSKVKTILQARNFDYRTPTKYPKPSSDGDSALVITSSLEVSRDLKETLHNDHENQNDCRSSTESEFSDGVTLDLSIADVSGLTNPTALISRTGDKSVATMDEENSSTHSLKAASEAKRSEASSSQPSEAAAPLLAKALRMRPMSDEFSTDSFFAARALLAKHWNNPKVDREAPFNKATSVAPMRDGLLERQKVVVEPHDDCGAVWDIRRIEASFPMNNATTSGDIFEFESEWEIFSPTAPQVMAAAPPPASQVRPSSYSLSIMPTSSAPASTVHHLSNQTISHRTDAVPSRRMEESQKAVMTPSVITNPIMQQRPTPTWKRRAGLDMTDHVESLVRNAIKRESLMDPNNPVRPTNVAKPFVDSSMQGYPISSLHMTEAHHAALLNRLETLKEARKRRSVATYGRPDSATYSSASRTTTSYSRYSYEQDEHSSSTPSTNFGGRSFMDSLEVD